MRVKRFLLHNAQLDQAGGLLSCSRCAASLKVEPQKQKALYEALRQLDNQACAKVQLDPEGAPQPVAE